MGRQQRQHFQPVWRKRADGHVVFKIHHGVQPALAHNRRTQHAAHAPLLDLRATLETRIRQRVRQHQRLQRPRDILDDRRTHHVRPLRRQPRRRPHRVVVQFDLHPQRAIAAQQQRPRLRARVLGHDAHQPLGQALHDDLAADRRRRFHHGLKIQRRHTGISGHTGRRICAHSLRGQSLSGRQMRVIRGQPPHQRRRAPLRPRVDGLLRQHLRQHRLPARFQEIAGQVQDQAQLVQRRAVVARGQNCRVKVALRCRRIARDRRAFRRHRVPHVRVIHRVLHGPPLELGQRPRHGALETRLARRAPQRPEPRQRAIEVQHRPKIHGVQTVRVFLRLGGVDQRLGNLVKKHAQHHAEVVVMADFRLVMALRPALFDPRAGVVLAVQPVRRHDGIGQVDDHLRDHAAHAVAALVPAQLFGVGVVRLADPAKVRAGREQVQPLVARRPRRLVDVAQLQTDPVRARQPRDRSGQRLLPMADEVLKNKQVSHAAVLFAHDVRHLRKTVARVVIA